MDKNAVRFTCTLWICAAIFIAARYICAALLAAGSYGDEGIYNLCLERVGPFFPLMSIVCLLGGIVFAIAEAVAALRRNKK